MIKTAARLHWRVSVAVGLQHLFCASLVTKQRNSTLIWTHRNLGRSFVGAPSLRMQLSRFSLHSNKELEENFFHLWLPVGFRQNPVERLSRTGPLQPSSIVRSGQGTSSSSAGNPGTLSCWCCPRCCSNKAQTSHPGRCCAGRFVASGCHPVSAGVADRTRPTKQVQVQLARCGENRTGHAIDLPSGVWSQWGCLCRYGPWLSVFSTEVPLALGSGTLIGALCNRKLKGKNFKKLLNKQLTTQNSKK